MVNSFNLLTAEDLRKLKKGMSQSQLEMLMSKNSFECSSFKEFEKTYNAAGKSHFISQLKVINKLDSIQFNRLCGLDIGTRDGLNYKHVAEAGEFRLTQICRTNADNVLERRYFILDFNNTIEVEGNIRADHIYEITTSSFAILISEICSVKSDMEYGLSKEEGEKYIDHMSDVINCFIKEYENHNELMDELYSRF